MSRPAYSPPGYLHPHKELKKEPGGQDGAGTFRFRDADREAVALPQRLIGIDRTSVQENVRPAALYLCENVPGIPLPPQKNSDGQAASAAVNLVMQYSFHMGLLLFCIHYKRGGRSLSTAEGLLKDVNFR